MNMLKPTDFFDQSMAKTGILVDVRTPDEFAICHIPGAINIPLDQIETQASVNIERGKPLYLICQSGMRSERARLILESRGYGPIRCIEGGMRACESVRGAVVRHSTVLPLMRQVQLVAGLLVVLGVVLSVLVHPGFIGLCLFVGVGLTLAGATGFCGLALLLAKMPWNRVMTQEGICQSPR